MANQFFPGGPYPYPAPINPSSLINNAANVKGGDNPSFTADDFLAFYPHFQGTVENAILNQFITLAHAIVKESRWREMWTFGMSWFIAHFLTLYLQTVTESCAEAGQVIEAARARGFQVSKSVGDVSVNYDYTLLMNGLERWGQWNLTQYGILFANTAKLLAKAGMYVW